MPLLSWEMETTFISIHVLTVVVYLCVMVSSIRKLKSAIHRGKIVFPKYTPHKSLALLALILLDKLLLKIKETTYEFC